MKNNSLDTHLSVIVALQKELWYATDTGVGAACLFVPSTNEAVYSVCRDVGHNCFAHAEYGAIDIYTKTHGVPLPDDAVMITTISPCSNPNSSWRVGNSCNALIKQYGIKHVHTGFVVDPSHVRHSFNMSVTANEQLAKTCKNLHGLFNVKAPRLEDGSMGRLVTAYKNDAIFSRVFKGNS